jgi:monovalent cation/hydrogen antiporter
LKVAVVAIGAGSVHWLPALGDFAWASAGGLLVGGALGLMLSFVRRKASSPLTVTALSLVSPFVAYVLGEEVGASGVLAVVVTGLILGYRSPTEVPASIRLTESATWAALRFALEGAVFALIGLQLRAIVTSLDGSRSQTIVAAFAVLAAVILSRPLWLLIIHFASRIGSGDTGPSGLRGVVAVSWAGMRGVVSLAAAQTLPTGTPYRSLLLVCTITVILGTLVLQGSSLPWFIRRLGIEADHRVDDLSERAAAHARVNAAINERVDELSQSGQISDRQAELMRKWASLRDWRSWDEDDKARAFGQRLSVLSDWRRSLLGIERSVIVGMRNAGELTEEVLREMQHDLDLEEALLERRSEAIDGHLEQLPGTDRSEVGEQSVNHDPDAVVDHRASIDDADVSALLLDEQRAGGTTIGQQAARTRDSG